jgi:hypothetical protein
VTSSGLTSADAEPGNGRPIVAEMLHSGTTFQMYNPARFDPRVFMTTPIKKFLGGEMNTSNFYRAEHWRRRAAGMRSIAEQFGVLARARTAMLRIDEYDRLAGLAECASGQISNPMSQMGQFRP